MSDKAKPSDKGQVQRLLARLPDDATFADITARARQRLFRHEKLKHGITERQVDRLMRQLILEEGGDRTAFVILQSPKPGSANPFKTDRPLERGDILAIDTGA